MRKQQNPAPSDVSQMIKILIIKQGALGDIIMATGLIKQIQSNFADSKIYILSVPEYAEIFAAWPDLKKKFIPRKGILNIFKTIHWIRQQKFDLLFDLQSSDRTGLLTSLSGIPKKIGNHPRYPYNISPDKKYTGDYHIYDRMLEILAASGINAKPTPPWLPATAEEKHTIDNWLKEKGLETNSFIILHPGSSQKHVEKRWPFFDRLSKEILSIGFQTVWVGSKDERDLVETLSMKSGINAVDRFSINGLAYLGKYARFAVTNDSAPMHILSCSGIPVYALFGPTNWQRSHAIGQGKRVIKPACNSSDIKDISVEYVLSFIRKDGALCS